MCYTDGACNQGCMCVCPKGTRKLDCAALTVAMSWWQWHQPEMHTSVSTHAHCLVAHADSVSTLNLDRQLGLLTRKNSEGLCVHPVMSCLRHSPHSNVDGILI
jgi:hypothetical protein